MDPFPLRQAATAGISLEAALGRLGRHPAVDGIVTVGSTGRDSLTPSSDYDVLVVLAEMPVPLQFGITYVDGRLTDLLFVTTAQVDRVLAADTALEGDAWEGRIARWLLAGQVVFDRHGRLRQAQAKLSGGNWIRPLEDIDAYGAWIGVNYALLHTRRLMGSGDPVYLYAAELRMSLYGVVNLMLSYFRVRKMPWEGDKAAISYLMTHDRPYFDLLMQFLREPDPHRKFALYERLSVETLAPLGALWDGECTVLWNDDLQMTEEMLERGLGFWEKLVEENSQNREA